jgi:hypothetical protein
MRALLLGVAFFLGAAGNPSANAAADLQEVAKPGEPLCALENRPVRYGKLKDVRVVVAEIVDVDETTSYSSLESSAVPQVLLRVQHSFSGRVPKELVAEVPFPGAPYNPPSSPAKGDQVIVTLQKEPVGDGWSCGRLWPCDKRPQVRWVGIEIYKRVNWP